MKIVLASNKRYESLLLECKASIEKFGYEVLIYDLGDLGYGKPFFINDNRFQSTGNYDSIANLKHGIKVSRSLFKPLVIEDARNSYPDELIVWLDSDTKLFKPLNIEGDYDIGVAKRSPNEIEKTKLMIASGMGGYAKYQGFHNAGVIFFNPTENTNKFVQAWKHLTGVVENDQLALNALLEDTKRDLVIKKFPYEYNRQTIDDKTVIFHYKGKEFDCLKRISEPYYDLPDYCVAKIGKSGCTSLAKVFLEKYYPQIIIPENLGTKHISDFMPITYSPKKPVYMFVRNPAERFISAMAQRKLTDIDSTIDSLLNDTIIKNTEGRNINVQRDFHFFKQLPYALSGTKLYKFPEHINKFEADLNIKLPLENKNSNTKLTITDIQLKSIQEYYLKDFALYDSIIEAGQIYDK